MKFGDRVTIKGFDGFFDGVKAVLVDIGVMQNPETKNMGYVYVVEVNDKYHKNFQEAELALYDEAAENQKDLESLMEDKEDVEQATTD